MSDVWLNGAFVEETTATISVRDTGLLHAAGVFTTMRCYGGKVFSIGEHLRRLRDSCDALFVPLTYNDATLTEAAHSLVARNGFADARLRLTVTRGESRLDPLHGPRLSPTVLLTAAPLEPYPREYYERGLTVVVLDEQKLNPYDMQAGHKTLNYFSRLAALREANRREAGEALWFNVHNYLQSGSISNVFLVIDDKLVTPPAPVELRDAQLAAKVPYSRSNALPGVTRQTVLHLAKRLEIPAEFGAVTINDLLAAREVFLTNSIMGIMPVCRIERRAVGDEQPGPITQNLAEAYAELVSDL